MLCPNRTFAELDECHISVPASPTVHYEADVANQIYSPLSYLHLAMFCTALIVREICFKC